jgi:hypothetical protein
VVSYVNRCHGHKSVCLKDCSPELQYWEVLRTCIVWVLISGLWPLGVCPGKGLWDPMSFGITYWLEM